MPTQAQIRKPAELTQYQLSVEQLQKELAVLHLELEQFQRNLSPVLNQNDSKGLGELSGGSPATSDKPYLPAFLETVASSVRRASMQVAEMRERLVL